MLHFVLGDTSSIPIITKLAREIWPIAYNGILTENQLEYMLQLFYSGEALTNQIENSGHQFVIAYQNSTPVGFASYSKKNANQPSIYRLHKLYLLPSEQGKGSGKALLEFVVNACENASGKFLELNVNKQNAAIHFYTRNHFTITDSEIIEIGNGYIMDDYIMTRKIGIDL